MKTFFYPVIVLLLTSMVCKGQAKVPVVWSFSTKQLSKHEVLLTLTADVASGWHMYSQFSGDEGPQPAQFIFDDQEAYRPVGRPEERGRTLMFYDSLYEMKITWLSGTVSFLQKLVLTQPVSRITGRVEYMVCNKHMCIPDKHGFAVDVYLKEQ